MRRTSRVALVQVAGVALIIALLAWWAHRFPVAEMVLNLRAWLGPLTVWGGILYALIFAGCNLLLLPGGVLTIGGGLLFGLWWGFLISLVGNIIGSAVAFGISRGLGRAWVERKFLSHPKWRALDAAIEREGWKIIALSQIHPLFPTSLIKYLYGITRVRFSSCMLWVGLGQAPGLFLYVYLGTLTQHGLRVLRGDHQPENIEYVVWLGGLALTVAVTFALGRIALRLLAEATAAPASPSSEPARWD